MKKSSHYLYAFYIKIVLGISFLSSTNVTLTTAQQESIMHTEILEKELPGSRDLNTRLGKPGHVDKEYATITFKKRTIDDAKLTGLTLEWHGKETIPSLSASLFKKESYTQQCLPTEEHHLSDGQWNAKTQTISFNLKNHIDLQGTTSLALVFVISPELEKTLKTGNFCFVPSSLPEPFQSAKKDALALVHKAKQPKHPVS